MMSANRMGKLFATLKDAGIGGGRDERHAWATEQLGRAHNPVTTFRELTDAEVGRLIDMIEHPPPPDDEPCDEPGCTGHDPDGWCVGEAGDTWPARGAG